MKVIIARRETGDGFDVSTDSPQKRPAVHCADLEQAVTYANGLVDGWNRCRQSIEGVSWDAPSFIAASRGTEA